MANVLLFVITRYAFIRQPQDEAARPRVHVSTLQVTFPDQDARTPQTIHLCELSNATRSDDKDGISETVDLAGDESFKLAQTTPTRKELWAHGLPE
ncbi:hypothetical protein FS749_009017 [Ceratobasidium sp. UAMH 11750]|nr:hypothetical protein FS749_009017 [Ceratobasidium sp. UAMH 11750]